MSDSAQPGSTNITATIAATITAIAPGRVNLIGDHTDYTGGLVLPMAIHLATTITGTRGGGTVSLTSADEPEPAVVPLDVSDPTACQPTWATYVGGVIKALQPSVGFTGTVTTTVPIGAGLSSSAAFEVALALALGMDAEPLAVAQLCQRAENEATGVPTGIMDQLASAAGAEGSALLIDCHALTVEPVTLPGDIDIVVVHSGQARTLAGSGYAERAAQLATAEAIVGPLRLVTSVDDLGAITDEVVHRRARHVVTENQRVRDFVSALRTLSGAELKSRLGELLLQGQTSLRDDFENSTEVVEACIERLMAIPGVHGVRMTGGGFGGCVVALTEPGVLDEGWLVRPSGGARLVAGN
jgi:galactokinase